MARLSPLALTRAQDASGNAVSGATLQYYKAGTSTPAAIYADVNARTSLGASLAADSSGYWPVHYLADPQDYKAVVTVNGVSRVYDWLQDGANSDGEAASTAEPFVVDNVTALRSEYWGGATPAMVQLLSSWAAGDGGGTFRLDAADVSSTDNGGTVVVDAVGNRWKRLASRVFNIRDFGADNTGATDSYPALNAAAAAANAAGGGVVLVPAGSYLINTRFDFPGSNIVIQGEGLTISRLVMPATGTLTTSPFAADSKTNVGFSDLEIDCNERPTTSNAHPVIIFVNCTDPFVRNCLIHKWTFAGVAVNGGTRAVIENNLIRRTTVEGSYANYAINISNSAGTSIGHQVRGNRCLNSGSIYFGSDQLIEGNLFNGNGFGAAIVTGPDAGTGNVVRGNTCCYGATAPDVDGVRPAGMELNSIGDLVVGNVVHTNGGCGIASFSARANIVGNVIFNNGQGLATGSSAADDQRAGITLAYDTVSKNASRSIVAANRCHDTGGGTQLWGVRFSSSSVVEVQLNHNNLQNNATAPISLNGATQISTPSIQYEGSVAFSPGTLAAGAFTSTAITLNGAAFGDAVVAGYSADLLGCTVTAHVSAANAVRIAFHNATGGSVALGSGTVYVRLFKRLAV